MSDTWWVYLVSCADGSLYTGATNDIARRLAVHNAGRGARYTRSRLPVSLAWLCACDDKRAALSLEAHIKRWPRTQKLELVGDASDDATDRPRDQRVAT